MRKQVIWFFSTYLALAMATYFIGVPESLRFWTVTAPVLAIALAFITRSLMFSMLLAILYGSFVAKVHGEGLSAIGLSFVSTGKLVISSGTNEDNLLILGFVVCILCLVAVVTVSGGLQGMVNMVRSRVKDSTSVQRMTAFMGGMLFIDDYANTMVVGSSMRGLSDRFKVSREKLAFLVDATSAPIAGVALVSTWVGYEVGLFQSISEKLALNVDGYSMFLNLLSYRFYCFFMIFFVFWNVIFNSDFGPMLKAQKRAASGKGLFAEGSDPMSSDSDKLEKIADGVRVMSSSLFVPIAVLLVGVFGGLWIDGGGLEARSLLSLGDWRFVLSNASSGKVLFVSAFATLVTSVIWGVVVAKCRLSSIVSALFSGLKGAMLPVLILILAWSLKGVCDELGTGDFLASLLKGQVYEPLFPAAVFILAGFTAFATGTSWGTMAILIPTVAPLAAALGGDGFSFFMAISLAAILDGAILGDHCSPISDTTIMSSISSSCDLMDHVKTQMPYSLLVGFGAVIFGYLPVAFGVSLLPLYLGVFLLLGLGLYLNRRFGGIHGS